MKKILFIVIIFYYSQINAQEFKSPDYNIFIGSYVFKQINSSRELAAFEIKKINNNYVLIIKTSNKTNEFELKKFNKFDLESQFYSSLPKNTLILGSLENILIFNVPIKWSQNDFVSNTGFFIMSMAGPLEIIKKRKDQ